MRTIAGFAGSCLRRCSGGRWLRLKPIAAGRGTRAAVLTRRGRACRSWFWTARRREAMAAGDGENLVDNARMQPRRLVDIDVIDIRIRTDVDIGERTVEAGPAPHIGIVA